MIEDRDIMINELNKHGCNLFLAIDKYKNDLEIVKLATEKNIEAFQFASSEIKSNKNFCLEIIEKDGFWITELSHELTLDYEIVKKAVKSNPLSFNYIHFKFRKNRSIYCLTKDCFNMTKYDVYVKKIYHNKLNDFKCNTKEFKKINSFISIIRFL